MEEKDDFGGYMHFRVFTETVDLNDFLSFIKSETDLLVMVKEFGKGNREHIHATLKLKEPKSTFTDHLKKKFPSICGNRSYGLRPLRTWDENFRYIYKGTASDYPDILYTEHTEDEWKDYYKRYWDKFKSNIAERRKEVNMGCQNDPSLIVEAKSKTRTKQFNEKIADELWAEHRPIFGSIWYYHGCTDKDFEPINSLEFCQDYIAGYLMRKLGTTAKNLDNFIFERMYRGLYNYILGKCPYDLQTKPAVHILNTFRHKL